MEIQQIIKDAAQDAVSYDQYRALVQLHTDAHTNTGDEVTEALAAYTALNNQRMKRLDKTMKLLPKHQSFLETYNREVFFLIITESWCGDAAQTMPMMNKIAIAAGIDFKVVLRDEHPLLMNQFLTNGARSIAKLILVDKNTYLPMAEWGPRPTKATQLVANEMAEKGTLSPDFKEVLQNWYNQDKGKDTENDLVEMLKAFNP